MFLRILIHSKLVRRSDWGFMADITNVVEIFKNVLSIVFCSVGGEISTCIIAGFRF